MNKSNRFSPEVRERAVRMVQEHRGEYPSLWAAVASIAPKIGCVPQTLLEWVKRAQVDAGTRPGVSTEEARRVKELEREVIGQLGPEQLKAIAQQLGINPAQTQDAVEKAVPLMLGGLARNASAPEGASALHGALQRDHAGLEPAGLLGSIHGSGGSQEGLGIIGHIFGQQRDQAAQVLGQSSGISAPAAAQLMGMLAPLLMAVMGNMTRNENLDSGRLGQELGNQPAVRGGLAGGLLDALLKGGGNGINASQVMQAGSALLRAFGKPS